MRILLADDDEVSCLALESLLRKRGHDVVTVADGAEAWEVLKGDEPPRLAILDWVMPGMDGAGVCRRVRGTARLKGMYLILLTSRDGQEHVVQGLRAGANDYVTKPFHNEELEARVNVGVQVLQLQHELALRVRELEDALAQVKHLQELLRCQNQELRALATLDHLTGCLNRRAFYPDFESHWNATQRYGHPLSCVVVDIDHFKWINDTHGHGVGDQVLQRVAETLKNMMRNSDLICRYGGEEFCILLPYVDITDAARAGERFRLAIAARCYSGIAVTASVGVSSFSLGARDPRELLDQADKAMYAAKRGGRNCVVRCDEIPADAALEKAALGTQTPREAPAEPRIPFHAVTVLLSALAYRHAGTAEHSRRLADLCAATAGNLLSHGQCYTLEVAALLHDIGKLAVPDAILLKPGPLSEEEWTVMRSHEQVGVEIVRGAFTFPELTAIVENHHAWYGGKPEEPGLPRGTDIPEAARILSIADAFDAMVSERVYRKGRSYEEAFAELRRCSGTQFDPELVERFIGIVQARYDRRTPDLAVSKETALQIGLQKEGLAGALDAQDIPTLATRASRLSATAGAYGVGPIAEVASRLEQSATSDPNQLKLSELTVSLLELCRATYDAYLPRHGECPPSRNACPPLSSNR